MIRFLSVGCFNLVTPFLAISADADALVAFHGFYIEFELPDYWIVDVFSTVVVWQDRANGGEVIYNT